MRTSLSLTILAAFALTGCGGNGSPVTADLGGGETQRFQLGPAGGLIRGQGALAGFELELPAGALAQLTTVTLQLGADLELFESVAVTPTVRLSTQPDPGPLHAPATLRWRLDWPAARPVGDLLVAGRVPVAGLSSAEDRAELGLAAELGAYDRQSGRFSSLIGRLGPMQVRASLQPRALEDAQQLLDLALQELGRGSDGGLLAADQRLAEALRADPFFAAGRFLRALTRIALWCNDRSDTGAGLDSLGELLQAYGLDLASKSLLRRVRDNDWPARLQPVPRPPSPEAVVEFLLNNLGNAALGSLADLDYVPAGWSFKLDLPAGLLGAAGEREIDSADLLLLRGALSGLVGALSQLRGLDLSLDSGAFTGAGPRPADLATWLAANLRFGKPARDLGTQSASFWVAGLRDLDLGLRALMAETDGQSDDLLVFGSGFGRAAQERWAGNLGALFRALRGDGAQSLALGSRGALALDLRRLLAPGHDPRAGFPDFDGFLPLAGSLGDPSLGGVLPSLDQDRAAELYHLVSAHSLAVVPGLVIDGRALDWPVAGEALRPGDPAGDATGLPGLDLSRVFLALQGDALVCRLDLHRESFGDRQGQTNVYGIELRPVDDASLRPGQLHRVELRHDGTAWKWTAWRQHDEVPVRLLAAAEGQVLEFAVNRFDLLPPDEPRRAWVLRAFASGLDQAGKREVLDRSRRILVRF